MKTYYDTVADVFCVVFGNSIPQRFEHIGPVSVAFDEAGKVCEIEVASAGKNLAVSKDFWRETPQPLDTQESF